MKTVQWISKYVIAGLFAAAISAQSETALERKKTSTENNSETREQPLEILKARSKWSFEFGVGIIGDTIPSDYIKLQYDRFHGDGEGLTYNFTAAYQLHEFDFKIMESHLQPTIEIPFMLTLVDQNKGGMIPDFNGGLMVRWRNFPWNIYIYTTFALGGGLSYSYGIWEADHSRHPGEDRSRLKFWLPIEFTLALPKYPQHQLTLFIDHQSGGGILDKGGIDAWGFGYRYIF